MSTLSEVLVHDFAADSFPKCVTELLAQFSRPLPQRFASNEVKVALSPGVREIYEEVLQTPSLFLEKDDISIDSHPGRPVTDVVDTVLSCVRMVRTATTFPDGLQQARISWISLLSLLAFAISEDIFILYVFCSLVHFLFNVFSAKTCHFFCLKRRENRRFTKVMDLKERLLSSYLPFFLAVFENKRTSLWTSLLPTKLVSDESFAAPEYGVNHEVISKQLVGRLNNRIS